MTTPNVAGKVLSAMAGVIYDFSKHGVGKDRENEMQKYWFRGIDDVINALSPLLAKHKLMVVPTYSNHRTELRELGQGDKKKATAFALLDGTFQIVSLEDGSSIVSGPFPGEAMDSGDKGTNKAMSAAMKYFAIQTFAIPVEGIEDADAEGIADEPQGPKVDVVGLTKKMQATTTREELLDVWGEAKKACGAAGNDGESYALLQKMRDAHGKTLAQKARDGNHKATA